MQAKDLKRYLAQERERVEKVLEFYEYHSIWYSGDDLRCAPPGSENKTAVSVKLTDDLYSASYSDLKPYHGDLFGLLEQQTGRSFPDIMRGIHTLFGLENKGGKPKQSTDLLADIRKYKKKGERQIRENKKHDKNILDKYINMPHAAIVQECITPAVCKQFDIMYDPIQSRILFPHYDWVDTDKVVGITGRTTMSSELSKELDVPKYWNYIKGYLKTSNLYGFNHARNYLEKSNMLIIFEAEKSTLKQFTIERGEGYSVSVGGHNLAPQQVEFILKNTPIDTEIVIAFDKDVMTMVDPNTGQTGKEYLEETCKKFSKLRKTSYIFDTHNILGEKDSPIDKGYKIWQHLLKWRVTV